MLADINGLWFGADATGRDDAARGGVEGRDGLGDHGLEYVEQALGSMDRYLAPADGHGKVGAGGDASKTLAPPHASADGGECP